MRRDRLQAVTLATCLACLLPAVLRRASSAPSPAGPQARRHSLQGVVVAVDVAGARVFVAHDELAGYAKPGVLEVRVDDRQALARFRVGDRLRAILVVPAGAEPWLEGTVVTHASPARRLAGRRPAVAQTQARDALERARRHPRRCA